MEYRFATSQIDGELSLTNRFPAANILAFFAGESFGNWFCNGGILDGALLGLPNLSSSVDVRIGETGRVLELGERQLHGEVTMEVANSLFRKSKSTWRVTLPLRTMRS